MNKAILFEPELLAEVERESPAVYNQYCTTPFAKIEFANYGTSNLPMFMPKYLFIMLETLLKKVNDHTLMMQFFQTGWVFGKRDLYLKHDCTSKDPLISELGKLDFMMAACEYPYYTLETLMKRENVQVMNDIVYNAITYKEGQCFEAWKVILKCHHYFNSNFVEWEANTKNYQLPELHYLNIHAN